MDLEERRSEYVKVTYLLSWPEWPVVPRKPYLSFLQPWKLLVLLLCHCFHSAWKAVSMLVDEPAIIRTQYLFHNTSHIYSLLPFSLLAGAVGSHA